MAFNNLHGFMPKSKIPKWLNIAIGYGADGMTSGSLNNQIGILEEGSIANKRTRQIYLSFDVESSKN